MIPRLSRIDVIAKEKIKHNLRNLRVCFVFATVLLFSNTSFGEGTKEVSPNSTDLTGLYIDAALNYGSFRNCPNDNRIYFRIQDYTTEQLNIGFMFTDFANSGSPTKRADMYIRIFGPSGTQVSGPTKIYSAATSGTTGYIANYTQAINGPNIGGVTTGYVPLVFTPSANGEYWVEIYRSTDGATALTDLARNAPFWDLTVATTSGVAKTGRVHCGKWGFSATNGTQFYVGVGSFSLAAIYSYTSDNVVLKVAFDAGFSPLCYNLATNDYGVTNGGNWLNDRRSITKGATAPNLDNGYLNFLNLPDENCYPYSASSSLPTLPNPAIVKRGSNYRIKYNAPQAGDYILLLDFNGNDGAYTAGTADRWIEMPGQTAGISTYLWDGKDGLGNVVPASQTINLVISFRKGRINVPLYDAELNLGGIRISAVKPDDVPNARLYWDDSALTVNGSCNNNYNITAAGWNNSITGSPSAAHAWNGNGNPSQTIPAPAGGAGNSTGNSCDDFGNVRIINTWAWGVELKANLSTQLLTVDLSGTIWNDADNSASGTFNSIYTSGESGTNMGGAFYAALVDPNDNTVIRGALINSNGTYSLTEIPQNANNLILQVSTVSPTEDAAAPAVATLASNWVNTSPLTRIVSTATSNITGLDFGVNQKPTAVGSSTTITPIPTGTNTSNVSASLFGGSDTGGGTISSLTITAFPTNVTSVTINGVNYTSGTFPVSGVVVPTNTAGQPTQAILVDPVGDVAVTVSIPFLVTDNGGQQSTNTTNAIINFVPQADVQITKTPDTITPNVEGSVTFTLTAKNNGQNGVTGVSVSDIIPSGYTFVSASASAGSWASPTWSIGALAANSTATLTITATVNVSGVYANTATITGNETDPNNANNTSTSTPTPKPITSFTYNGPYCKDGANPTPTLSPNGVAGTYSAAPAGLVFVSTSTGQMNLGASTPGTYTVTNSVAASGAYAASSSTGTVTINALPTISGNASVCVGSTTALAGSGTPASSNPWVSSNISVATVSNGLVTGVAGGIATITYTDSNGCSGKVTVSVNSLPTSAISSSTNVQCFGENSGQIVVTASGGQPPYQYSKDGGTNWEPASGTSSSYSFINLSAGTYSIKVKDSNGCVSNQ